MARRFVLGVVLCAACYTQPAFDDPCTIACTTDCPDGDACGADGLCHAAGSAECSGGPGSSGPALAYASLQLGARSACGLGSDGAIYCWGDGTADQLGIDGATSSAAPMRVGSAGDTWDQLAVGADHACALAGGVVKCWGQDRDGASSGANGSLVAVPGLVTFPADAVVPSFDAIAAGGFHSCAIGSGQLWCWGLDEEVGVAAQTAVPIGSAQAWRAVSAGVDHTCAVTTAGEIDCWGANDDAQCGTNGSPIAQPSAVSFPPAAPTTTVVAVTAGAQRTCAILSATAGSTTGELWCWGDNASQLIDPSAGANVVTPTQIGIDETWSAIAVGHRFMCGVRAGAVTCWGQSPGGGLGDGLWSTTPLAYSAMRALGSADAITIGNGELSGGVDDTACLLASGAPACWGDNAHGAAGFGVAAVHAAPVEVAPPSGTTWAHVFAGPRHTCGATTDGGLWCWGDDEVGQVSASAGLGDTLPCTVGQCDAPRPVAAPVPTATEVSIGEDFTCALVGSAVRCWGQGGSGQLGSASTTAHTVASVEGAYVHLLGGGAATCAEPVAGDPAVCWGPAAGQLLEGPMPLGGAAATGMAQLAFGDTFGCGVQTTAAGGDRVCWGLPTLYQLGNNDQNTTLTTPTDMHNGAFTQITAASDHACAITSGGNVACWGECYHEQCGVNGVQTIDAPTQVVDPATHDALAGCTQVEQSADVSCAICGGRVLCWGEHDTGRGSDVTDGPAVPVALALVGTHTFVDVAVRRNGGCALDDQGALYCWGTSLHGENGDGGHGANVPTPIVAPVTP